MTLAGKAAIVTGAGGGGQGRAVALRLAAEGAAVVVSDIDEAGARETVRRIESAGGRAAFARADVSSEPDIRGLIDFAVDRLGGLDILVNNAGPYFPERLGRWDDTVRANVLGPMWATLHAIEPMRRRGGGAIVYYGSTSAVGHGRRHSPAPAYDVAKAAVMRLATTMAWMAEAYAIRVNCIAPDWVATDEIREYVAPLTLAERRARGVPDRLIGLDEIAGVVLRLAVDQSLSGRVVVWWCGHGPGLIPREDQGYERLEPF